MNKLNEDFTNLYKRWRGGKKRKEDKFDYKLIDLGLPSGTLWMDRNIGADTPFSDGYFYAWGETEEKNEYSWDTYKLTKELNKYNENDGKSVLDKEDDVVYLATNGVAHMSTKEQIEELINKTNNEWVENYKGSGVNGRLFTGSNGNSIFIPAAGYQNDSPVYGIGNYFYVWSASLDERNDRSALKFYSSSSYVGSHSSYRYCGYSVRGCKG